jgi:CheY-like chemotaxis protein
VSAKVKADQIAATGAKIVVTSCHNCVDGLADLIKHYKLDCRVQQLVDLVGDALVVEECAVSKKQVTVKPETGRALEGRKILVVDDEEDARTFLSTVLADAGATTIEAADGDQAIELAKRERPDLITLDISMPGRDGVDVFRELRGSSDTAGTAICVVTGHPEFREVIYAASVNKPDGYMNKPVDPDELVDGLRRILDLKEKKQ